MSKSLDELEALLATRDDKGDSHYDYCLTQLLDYSPALIAAARKRDALVEKASRCEKSIQRLDRDVDALVSERDALREALAKATKPSFYWDSEDSENGCDDLTVIMDNAELGEVVRVQCAATLPDQWAVGFINETGGFEARAFATEAEAVAFSEARTALGASHDA